MIPDELRGRVIAVYSMMFMGMAPLGALFAGTLAENIGVPYTVALGGAICIVAAGIFALNLKEFRTEAREIIIALNMASGQPPERATGAAALLAVREQQNSKKEPVAQTAR
jgi:MFS family permease